LLIVLKALNRPAAELGLLLGHYRIDRNISRHADTEPWRRLHDMVNKSGGLHAEEDARVKPAHDEKLCECPGVKARGLSE
jgi:hypothetical protein